VDESFRLLSLMIALAQCRCSSKQPLRPNSKILALLISLNSSLVNIFIRLPLVLTSASGMPAERDHGETVIAESIYHETRRLRLFVTDRCKQILSGELIQAGKFHQQFFDL
jgi:hypothetical protein